MKRREFIGIAAAAAAAPFPWSRLTHAARPPGRRAAVTIGIDQCAGLTRLNAAAAGARNVAQWLRKEGFTVKEFVDGKGEDGKHRIVTVSEVYDGIEELIGTAGLDQLVVYFSGHGFLVSNSEHWLLSKAPRNPNESILLPESVTLARRRGVRNVVFISDACRSTSASLGAQSLHGGLIFPETNSAGTGDVNVDQFFAALPGAYALELPVEESAKGFRGIFTDAFLEAYDFPDASMIKSVNGRSVVPNRLLKDYLVRTVRKRAEQYSIKLTQQPEARVESDESAYIGEVRIVVAWIPGEDDPPLISGPPPPTATLADVAGSSLSSVGLASMQPNARTPAAADVTSLSQASGFTARRAELLASASPAARVPRHFETGTGFIVWGARVDSALSDPPGVEILQAGDGKADAAIVRLQHRPATVAVRFADGSGTLVAAIPDYIANLSVHNGSVVDVSYLPSLTGPFVADDATMLRVNELRAAVAASAQYGVFRIEGTAPERREKAAELAKRIRGDKAVDPTLGLYAAYAYAEAGITSEIESVREYMRPTVQGELFDIAMLAAALSGKKWQLGPGTRPFCPLLTQGWSFLRLAGAQLPNEIVRAREYLRGGLWTTFEPAGMDLIEAMRRRP
jgi:hypothetical protein